MGNDVRITQASRQVVGLQHGRIEMIVQFLQNSHAPARNDIAVFWRQRGRMAHGFQGIVQRGERQVGMVRQHLFARGIELFGKVGDPVAKAIMGVRERERIEAAGFDVDWVIADTRAILPTALPILYGHLTIARQGRMHGQLR